MKKKMICMFVFLGTAIIGMTQITIVTASEEMPLILEENAVNLRASDPVLTRYWTTGWRATGNPAPQVKYFDGGNGYHGYLSKYNEWPQGYGTVGAYHGYFYHKSLPLPSPAFRSITELNIYDIPNFEKSN